MKRNLIGCACIVLGLSLVGCGSGGEETADCTIASGTFSANYCVE